MLLVLYYLILLLFTCSSVLSRCSIATCTSVKELLHIGCYWNVSGCCGGFGRVRTGLLGVDALSCDLREAETEPRHSFSCWGKREQGGLEEKQ